MQAGADPDGSAPFFDVQASGLADFLSGKDR